MTTTSTSGPPVRAADARVDVADLQDLLSEGVLVHGADGRVERANRAALALLDADELVGRDGFELWSTACGPDGRPLTRAQSPLHVTLATGAECTRLVAVPVRGGPTRWLTVRAVPLPTGPHDVEAPPAPRAVAVFVTRPSGDAEALAAARDRDHLLSIAQRMARLSVWRYDLGSLDVEWLDGDGRDLGLNGEHKTMDGYLNGIHPEDRPAHDEMFAQLFNGAPSAEIDIRYRWGDTWRHWHMWAESVLDPDSGTVVALWGTAQEITERREAEAAIRRLTMTDSLTELANRAQVHERLASALVEGKPGSDTGLLVLDVDHFHTVNERYGHPVGDALLVEIGRRLGAVTGPLRTPARLGGDEFAVVVSRTTTGAAVELAERLLADLTAPYLLPGADEPVAVSLSIGVTVCRTSRSASSSEVYRQADLAVTAAQSSGGGAVVLFDEALRSRVLSRLDMEGRLRSALGDDSVYPLYQPVFTLGATAADDRMTSCEALARMTAAGQLVPPSEFVGVAEESGLIVDLDVAVFSKAVRQVLAAPSYAGFGVAVNLSPLSLQVPGLVDRLSLALSRAGLDGRDLRVEITEGCLAEPTPTLVGHLRGLRELGARIGLDDFGTGYSALGYLRRFDLDFMKIDRSFVADVCTDRRSAAVVRAVVDLAHAHDLAVVAEGIETADQLESLRDMRCDMVQGFHLGRPMPVDQLLDLAAGSRP